MSSLNNRLHRFNFGAQTCSLLASPNFFIEICSAHGYCHNKRSAWKSFTPCCAAAAEELNNSSQVEMDFALPSFSVSALHALTLGCPPDFRRSCVPAPRRKALNFAAQIDSIIDFAAGYDRSVALEDGATGFDWEDKANARAGIMA